MTDRLTFSQYNHADRLSKAASIEHIVGTDFRTFSAKICEVRRNFSKEALLHPTNPKGLKVVA